MVQSGGKTRQWLFDPQYVDSIEPIMNKLVYYDKYFVEEQGRTTLEIVLDKILEELPDDLEEAVRYIYLSGMSQRSAARIIGVDHKTVKSRADRGINILKKKLTDTIWLASLIGSMLPESKEVKVSSSEKVFNILNGLTEIRSGNEY